MRKIVAEALAGLKTLPDQSVHTVVTSPPYFNLRDYGVDGQLGNEDTPEAYVVRVVEIFREVWRVLRDDGTVWLNIGDSYCTKPNGPSLGGSGLEGSMAPHAQTRLAHAKRSKGLMPGFKHKDLFGVPWMVAQALRSDGWYLRSTIIWFKKNPMPESVEDRPTSSFEYIFLLSKEEQYFYDAYAIKETGSDNPITEARRERAGESTPGAKELFGTEHGQSGRGGKVRRSGNKERKLGEDADRPGSHLGRSVPWQGTNRNRRNVWTVNTRPSAVAHFAVFPPELILPCIKAGTSEKGCCPKCGAPWDRVFEKGDPDLEQQIACGSDSEGNYNGKPKRDRAGSGAEHMDDLKARILAGLGTKRFVGWAPGCGCEVPEDAVVPCVVLDPFGGSGTTPAVAEILGREGWGVELNPEFAALWEQRKAECQRALFGGEVSRSNEHPAQPSLFDGA